MHYVRPLPAYLVERYHGWKATVFESNRFVFGELAAKGQQPRVMIVSCCDSRLHVTSIFGADLGELFIHRNIANLIPQYEPDGLHHGTSAAVEYGVRTLKVQHLIVLGHSGCGGVEGCYNMCAGHAPDLNEKSSFVGRWLDIMRPAYDGLPAGDDSSRKQALEKASILVSLQNLMTFPFIRSAVLDGSISLHGLWKDIGEGLLETYDPTDDCFVPL
ncbi:carbonic anhydrase [Yoonia vestfoldensis]|jgi:carbonic anhydrase|uniref:carbonic anhydrase n=1 Tax=Yoonia vestfoldensis TaxID=245188 RepID=A0A1Y0EEX5_9RHOB|nr:carbonic anhydrase [Yoonia vestfoldensis]ARU02186.1 carbonic anhydrase 1 [Yoonia vestfoldensis]